MEYGENNAQQLLSFGFENYLMLQFFFIYNIQQYNVVSIQYIVTSFQFVQYFQNHAFYVFFFYQEMRKQTQEDSDMEE